MENNSAPIPGIHPNNIQLFQELKDEHIKAEKLLKRIENQNLNRSSFFPDIKEKSQIQDGPFVPAINELRYVTKHLFNALESKDFSSQAEQLRRAKSHCSRSIYDNYDMATLICLEEIRAFKIEFSDVEIIPTVPDWHEIIKLAKEAQKVLEKNNDNQDRSEGYQELEQICCTLNNKIDKFDVCREELKKKRKSSRFMTITTITSLIIATIAVIVAFFK